MATKILLFENFDLKTHLKSRGVDTDKTRVVIDHDSGDVFFFIYNFSGKLIGYQKYNPNYEKINRDDPKLAKYYTWIMDEGAGKMIAAWGLESMNLNDGFVFIVEGIFDAARIQEAGYPAIAVLCNDPSRSMRNWLFSLPQKKIVIYDNDQAGRKLIKVGDYAYTVPTNKDMGDLNPTEAKIFIDECLHRSGFESSTKSN